MKNSRLYSRVLSSPLAVVVIAFAISILLVRPFGNYPVNDDWGYAWLSLQLARTGKFVVDVELATSVVLQAYLGAFFIKIFGFSHLLLRALTWLITIIVFFTMDRILFAAGVRRGLRTAALLLVCINPLFMNLADSFMTEMYGNVLGLAAAAIWFWSRRREAAKSNGGISWTAAVLSGLVFGASFWVRQTVILVLPGLAAANLFVALIDGGWKRGVSALARILVAGVIAGAICYAYQKWLYTSGNLKEGYVGIASQITRFNWGTVLRGTTAILIYMTAFLFPFLLLTARLIFKSRARIVCGVLLLALGICGFISIRHASPPDAGTGANLHPVFPFLGNVIINAGVGPITLVDTFWVTEPAGILRPRWNNSVWMAVTVLLLAMIPLWSGIIAESFTGKSKKSPNENGIGGEVALAGLFVAFISSPALIQTFQNVIIDRYLITNFLFLIFSLAVILERTSSGETFSGFRKFALAAVPIAFFSIAGVHDYFRINDARWEFVNEHVNEEFGAINGGIEPILWLKKYRWPESATALRPDWHYLVAMSPQQGYVVAKSIPIHGWLAKTPDVLLLKSESQ